MVLKGSLASAHASPTLQQTTHASLYSSLPSKRISSGQLFWMLQCFGWIVFGAAMFTWGLDFMSPRNALVNKVLLVLLGLTLTVFFRFLFHKLREKRRSPLATVAILIGVSFTGALVWRETHTLLFRAYSGEQATGSFRTKLVAIPLGLILYDGFVLLAWSLLYFAINGWIEIEKQRARAVRAEAMAQAARLRALQAQLEPHFLFNTLNAISTLVVERQNADAAMMIARLSDFLRLTLDTADTPEIPVAEELEFVRRYLEIEQVRFGSRLRVTIDAPPEAMSGMVPALLLQPLVENAVKHGVLTSEHGGSISVSVTRSNGALVLCVADDGPGMPKDRIAVHGIGLSNTATRLRELYGDDSRFSLSPSSPNGLSVTIEIPFRSAESEAPEDSADEGRL
jgi:signal transduction histidine kinase